MTRRKASAPITKRRTTFTLPAESLATAQRIAHPRKVSLSSVVKEALDAGLRLQMAGERSEEVLASYRRAFSSFSDEEIAILDGIVLESPSRR
jgi:hypothetical protein